MAPPGKLGGNSGPTKSAVNGERKVLPIGHPMVMGFDGMAHLLHLGLIKFHRSLQLRGLMNYMGHLAIEKVVKNVVKGGVQIHGQGYTQEWRFVQLVTLALVGRPRGCRCRSQGCLQWFPTCQLPLLSPVPSCGGTW